MLRLCLSLCVLVLASAFAKSPGKKGAATDPYNYDEYDTTGEDNTNSDYNDKTNDSSNDFNDTANYYNDGTVQIFDDGGMPMQPPPLPPEKGGDSHLNIHLSKSNANDDVQMSVRWGPGAKKSYNMKTLNPILETTLLPATFDAIGRNHGCKPSQTDDLLCAPDTTALPIMPKPSKSSQTPFSGTSATPFPIVLKPNLSPDQGTFNSIQKGTSATPFPIISRQKRPKMQPTTREIKQTSETDNSDEAKNENKTVAPPWHYHTERPKNNKRPQNKKTTPKVKANSSKLRVTTARSAKTSQLKKPQNGVTTRGPAANFPSKLKFVSTVAPLKTRTAKYKSKKKRTTMLPVLNETSFALPQKNKDDTTVPFPKKSVTTKRTFDNKRTPNGQKQKKPQKSSRAKPWYDDVLPLLSSSYRA